MQLRLAKKSDILTHHQFILFPNIRINFRNLARHFRNPEKFFLHYFRENFSPA